MYKIKSITQPWKLIGVVVLCQLGFYLLYVVGFVPSFKISYVSTSVLGWFCLVLFYLLQFVFSKDKQLNYNVGRLICKKKTNIFLLVIIYDLLAIIGFFKLTINLFAKFSLKEVVVMIINDEAIKYLVYGSGNTILCNFSIVAMILLGLILAKEDKISVVLSVFTVILCFVYASVLYSRIVFLQAIFFCVVIIIRRYIYHRKIKVVPLLIIIVLLFSFLVISSGYRDYEREGYKFTESQIEWGITRIFDYPISTTNYSVEIVSSKIHEETFDEYELRSKVAGPEYTNLGSFGSVFYNFSWLFPFIAVALGIIYKRVWISFEKGNLLGTMVYPILLYNILEMWRIFYIGTTMAMALICICIVSYFFVKKSFVFEESLD